MKILKSRHAGNTLGKNHQTVIMTDTVQNTSHPEGGSNRGRGRGRGGRRNRPRKNKNESKDTNSNRKSEKKHKKRNRKKKFNKRQLFLEIQKLVHEMKPITVNGVVVENLDKSVDDHIKGMLEDRQNQENIYLTFLIHPSDPDFPYDLDFLNISLSIPQTYPKQAPSPTIVVLNEEIPKGFAANVEIGFKQIVATALHNRIEKNKTEKPAEGDIEMVGGNDLLAMLKTLDKYLEKFLSMKKKETIKIVRVIKQYDEEQKVKEEQQKKKQAELRSERKQKEMGPVTNEGLKKRDEEIMRFKQRLNKNHIRVFKENGKSTIFKLELDFQEECFAIEIENSQEITFKKLPVRLTVPKAYLSSAKKPLQLELDMSNSYNLGLMRSLADDNSRLIFGNLINNMGSNFNYMAADALRESMDESNELYWSITAQLNYFVEEIQKFMKLRADFTKWFDTTKALKRQLIHQCEQKA